MHLDSFQQALQKSAMDGWLFYDFRGSDPLASSILGLDPSRHNSRRWFYFIPARGAPTRIVHAIERGALDALPGSTRVYLRWRELHEQLRETLQGASRVAMQYSPNNAIPYVSRVDAGTVELVRTCGVDVMSSADLVSQFQSVLSEAQVATHQHAAEKISQLIDDTFAEIGKRIGKDGATTEYEIQQFMWQRYHDDGLVSDHPPIVATGPNSADPHYFPEPSRCSTIHAGDFVLVDTWAKQDIADSIYFDVTWVGFVGDSPPKEITDVFHLVRAARDATLAFIQEAQRIGKPIFGAQVDNIARGVIEAAGYGNHFCHRTGHSIHTETHGNGANLDNLETQDERRLLPGTCFSVEPGIYLDGKFGVRSEVNVYLTENDALVTGRPAQAQIVCVSH